MLHARPVEGYPSTPESAREVVWRETFVSRFDSTEDAEAVRRFRDFLVFALGDWLDRELRHIRRRERGPEEGGPDL